MRTPHALLRFIAKSLLKAPEVRQTDPGRTTDLPRTSPTMTPTGNDQIIAECDQVLRRDPKDAAALTKRGEAYRLKGDYDRAIADFGVALAMGPWSA